MAAHVDHLRYGFSLMNRWSARARTRSPQRTGRRAGGELRSIDEEWAARRRELRDEATRWKKALRTRGM